MEDNGFTEITCHVGGDDFGLFVDIVNQGIDSHLEAFTLSEFTSINGGERFRFNFHNSELPILIRRLREIGDERADSWADDIEFPADAV